MCEVGPFCRKLSSFFVDITVPGIKLSCAFLRLSSIHRIYFDTTRLLLILLPSRLSLIESQPLLVGLPPCHIQGRKELLQSKYVLMYGNHEEHTGAFHANLCSDDHLLNDFLDVFVSCFYGSIHLWFVRR